MYYFWYAWKLATSNSGVLEEYAIAAFPKPACQPQQPVTTLIHSYQCSHDEADFIGLEKSERLSPLAYIQVTDFILDHVTSPSKVLEILEELDPPIQI